MGNFTLAQTGNVPNHESLRVGDQVHLGLVLRIQKAIFETKLIELLSFLFDLVKYPNQVRLDTVDWIKNFFSSRS